MGVHRIGHQAQVAHVVVVAQARARVRRFVRAVVDRAVLGADHAPTAFGLETAQRGQHARPLIAHAGTVRHLVETIGRGDRAQF